MRTAVFDLDGTLLAGDSTASWLQMLLFASWPRGAATVIALPLCLILIWIRASRRIGASVLLWIATFGFDQDAVTQSIETFVKRFEQSDLALRWRTEGLAAMQGHLSASDRVIVVTAAPEWLAARLLASWGDVRVLGSKLARRWGGWVMEDHCFGENKCRALQDNGVGDEWNFAYTDSEVDAPLLAAATECGFIVNARPGAVARLKMLVPSHIVAVHWN